MFKLYPKINNDKVLTYLLFFLFISFNNISYGQPANNLIIKSIKIIGNKKTKEKIIFRELSINEGDTIKTNEIDNILNQSSNNLMNTSLFNFVEITHIIDTTNINNDVYYTNVIISCKERWYTWPIPFLYLEERNFNEWMEHKDLSRLSYGIIVLQENFRGRREQLIFGFKNGFNDLISIKYQNPGVNKSRDIGIGLSFNSSKEHNIFYSTKNNKQQILQIAEGFAIQNTYFHVNFIKRFGIKESLRLYGQYNKYNFADTLFELNPLFINSYQSNLEFFTLSMLYKRDYRDYIHYPLEGYFFDCEITKQGFDILKNETISILSIKSSLRKYWKLNDKLFYAFGVTGRLRLDTDESYYLTKGLGFGNDYIRGYENYVIDGKNFAYLKSNFKYNILPERRLKLPFIKSEKFNPIPYRLYLIAHSDVGYITNKFIEPSNTLPNSLLFGYGLGLDLVTYYDRAYRFDFSRNRMNEFVFSIQFTAPI